VHYQKVTGGWVIPDDNTSASPTTTTTSTATTTTTATTTAVTRCLALGGECWAVMARVGLACMDVLGKEVGIGSAQTVLDSYCDPEPLPPGLESSSVFDVFLYHNDNDKLCNCPDHYDPGFFSVIKVRRTLLASTLSCYSSPQSRASRATTHTLPVFLVRTTRSGCRREMKPRERCWISQSALTRSSSS
jgi:hypothetical protein